MVITTTAKRLAYVSSCLESLAEARARLGQIRVVVIDNGSKEPITDSFSDYSGWVDVLHYDRPTPLAETHNRGLAFAREHHRATHALVLNDDTRLGEAMLEELLSVDTLHPHALSTPLQLSYEEPYVIDAGVIDSLFSARNLVYDVLLKRPLSGAYSINTIVGAAIFGRLETYDAIGPFDPLFPFYGVDEDYCRRAKHLGVSLLLVPDAHLYHAHGRFQDTPTKDFNSWFFRWSTHQYGRMLLILKDPGRPLARGYFTVTVAMLTQTVICTFKLWPRGAFALMGNYFRLVGLSSRIAENRRDHYVTRERVTVV